MPTYFEEILKLVDQQLALDLKKAQLLYQQVMKGTQFEEAVQSAISSFIPGSHRVGSGQLDVADPAKDGKQLDLVIHRQDLAQIHWLSVPLTAMAAAGEIKTNLFNKADIWNTAQRVANAAAAVGAEPLPFFVVAGVVKSSAGQSWVADLLSKIVTGVEPAIFSFEQQQSFSAFRVHATSPLRLIDQDGHPVTGLVVVDGAELSPSLLCYFWLWAVINTRQAQSTNLDYRYMRDALQHLFHDHPVKLLHRTVEQSTLTHLTGAALELADPSPTAPLVLTPLRGGASAPLAATLPVAGAAEVSAPGTITDPVVPTTTDDATPTRVMRIVLSAWGDQSETWDESPWGGDAEASRRGFGYYPGMSDQDLVDSARVFWKFKPERPTWQGIEHAVVTHKRVIVAVLEVDRFIGPVWGRYGFQGRVVHDGPLPGRLIGKKLPAVSNPVTTVLV